MPGGLIRSGIFKRRAASAMSGVERSAKARDSDSASIEEKIRFQKEGLRSNRKVRKTFQVRRKRRIHNPTGRSPAFLFLFRSCGFAPDDVLVVTTVDQRV